MLLLTAEKFGIVERENKPDVWVESVWVRWATTLPKIIVFRVRFHLIAKYVTQALSYGIIYSSFTQQVN